MQLLDITLTNQQPSATKEGRIPRITRDVMDVPEITITMEFIGCRQRMKKKFLPDGQNRKSSLKPAISFS
ncbi:MAG TPA: hypothetical protein VKJ65_02150, partial [Phycisphaerae bacterium]|nr:hypothetical protein [Phycisphaerae bacterium]